MNDQEKWTVSSLYLHMESIPNELSTIKKEIIAIINCVRNFEIDSLNQEFLLRIDYQTAKHVLEKRVNNLGSKQNLSAGKLFLVYRF